ncbi:major facilitator superfamily domain-containing protein [Mucor mucedo]|uniref:major facilitator superfamily domain-containing protein n=1 Tax=Mucor mucedo TaxID=29922 RepID=UPI00221FDD4F|nr:major facilitator superfamily domain-containing protein [Mucor mucedo]KAI7888259.1 major facilitator superfamily domain-containing protein [Mucor mucedo]
MLEKIDTTYTGTDMDLIHTGSHTLVDEYHGFSDKTNNHSITPEDTSLEEKKILKSLDIHMMPLFCIFYFVDFLDRANIGNATLAGIQDDLHLTPAQLSTAISAFYITYIIFEVPSNMVLKRTNAVMWLSSIMLLWGFMTVIMAFAHNFAGLLVCRLLLGAAESGYVPGILYMMSKVYRPREFGLRVALLICMSSIAGIVSGPIAYGTSFLEGKGGLHGWQYLFIIEGIPTVILSVISFFYLFDDVQKVPWLSVRQKALHQQYTQTPKGQGSSTWVCFVKSLKDWKTTMFSVVYFLNAITVVSCQVFIPTIIDGFGFPVLTSQLLSAPPYVMQTVMIIAGGYMADKYTNKRGVLMATGFFIAAVGYMLLIVLESRWSRYASLFVIASGIGLQAPANVGWSSINFPDLEIRVIAVAIVVMVGNSGGIVSSYLYPLSDGPHYYFGNIFNLVCGVIGALWSGLTSYLLYRENKKMDRQYQEFGSETGRDNGQEEEGQHQQQTQFRYYY